MRYRRVTQPAVLSVFILCALALTAVVPGRSARAAGFHIAAFYTATKAAVDKQGKTAPTQTSTFAAGTTGIGYYIRYAGATPGKTAIKLVERRPDGTSVQGEVHVLHYSGGSYANYFYDDPAFAPGAYSFNLYQGKTIIARAHFTVKRGVAVPLFYTTTGSAMQTWSKNTALPNPKKTAAFPSGTVNVGYFFGYAGVTPKKTTFRATVYGSNGRAVIVGSVHTLHHVTGYFGNYFYDQPSFPKGTYRIAVRFANGVTASTKFTIGKTGA